MITFTPEEVIKIARKNTEDLGNISPLTDKELICLKTGENLTLSIVARAKAILELSKPSNAVEFVTRSEFVTLLEAFNGLAAKTMFMFMILERKGLLSEREIYKLADELAAEKLTIGEPNGIDEEQDGHSDRGRTTEKQKRTARRTSVASDSGDSVPRRRGRRGVRTRPTEN